MIKVKTICDKCGKEIDGRLYRVSVDTVGEYSYGQIQMPKYLSYEICQECMGNVITEDVVGSPFMMRFPATYTGCSL